MQNTNILQPIFDGEKLLQVFKVCKSALLPAKECTANPSCKEFNYTLQNCLLEKHIKGTNRSALIICKKNKKGNMPLSRYTGSIFLPNAQIFLWIEKLIYLLDFCPDGYRFEEGESDGATINSGMYLSLEDCAKTCRDNKKCKSFEHSIYDNDCALNSAELPNSPQKREYVFCSKEGEIRSTLFNIAITFYNTCIYYKIVNYFLLIVIFNAPI